MNMKLGAFPLSAIDSPASPALSLLMSHAMGGVAEAGIDCPRELAAPALPSLNPVVGMWDTLGREMEQRKAEQERER